MLHIRITSVPTGEVLWSESAPFAADSDGGVSLGRTLAANEAIYGLERRTAPATACGNSYVMWNTDEGTAAGEPIYESNPYFLSLPASGHATGAYVANTHYMTFDVGATSSTSLAMAAAGGEIDLFFFEGGAAPEDDAGSGEAPVDSSAAADASLDGNAPDGGDEGPFPLGATWGTDAVHFRVRADAALAVELDLFAVARGADEVARYPMTRASAGQPWAADVPQSALATLGFTSAVFYGYRAWGRIQSPSSSSADLPDESMTW